MWPLAIPRPAPALLATRGSLKVALDPNCNTPGAWRFPFGPCGPHPHHGTWPWRLGDFRRAQAGPRGPDPAVLRPAVPDRVPPRAPLRCHLHRGAFAVVGVRARTRVVRAHSGMGRCGGPGVAADNNCKPNARASAGATTAKFV